MKRKNATRHALFTSIISLLLCVSMLMGTTFAWFTDEVVSGKNTIAAGNLDVELYAGGNKVDSSTELFKLGENTVWEPGMVVYENLQVKNAGTLALKYQMTLNFGDENATTEGNHKLSEVLKVAVIDHTLEQEASESNPDFRNRVLGEAKAAAESTSGKGVLEHFKVTGELEPNAADDTKAIVIFWEPNTNEIDNLYNINNGKTTTDGDPLHIEFGVNLQATQKMSESDSFGKDYDKNGDFLPEPIVNNLGAQTVSATTSFPNGTDVKDWNMDVVLQFLPNDSLEEAEANGRRYWHADYVISADKDIQANSVALAGYYSAFCDDFNNGHWVVMASDSEDPIVAGTEIRLVEMLGGGGITVNYENICEFGNDGTGFLCGIADLSDGANAGTTVSVELRIYETTGDPTTETGTKNVETGNYVTVGSYSYTFPAAPVADEAALDTALEAGITSVKLAEGEYTITVPSAVAGESITLEGSGDSTVVDFTEVNYANDASITFKNMKFQGKNENIMNGFGIQGTTGDIVYENCTFDGAVTNEYFGTVTYKNCTFTGTGYITTYAVKSATFENCKFNKADSRAVLVYSHGDNPCVVTLNKCTFTAEDKAHTYAGDWTSAVEIDTTNIPTAGTSVTITECTADANYSGIYRDKSTTGKANAVITIDGVNMSANA